MIPTGSCRQEDIRMFNIALRNIFRHKARSIISLSTIAFGCVALMFVAGFFTDSLYQMRESYINAQIGHLQVFKKGYAKNGKISPYNYLIDDPEAIAKIVFKLPQVKAIGTRMQFSGLISLGDASLPCMAQGVDIDFDRTYLASKYMDRKVTTVDEDDIGLGEITRGAGLSADDIPETIILGKGLAEALSVEPGAYVTLMTNTIHGGINAMDMHVKGVLATADKNFDDISLRMPIATAQSLLNTTSVQNIVIKLKRTEDTVYAKQVLTRLFAKENLDLEIKTWDELSDFYVKTADLFNTFHWVMRCVISIAVILGIFNTMNMSVMERFSEIGTLMAMGIRRRGILSLFLFEGLLLGLIGGGIGIVLGFVILSGIGHVGIVMPPPPGATMNWISQPAIVGDVVVFTFILSIVIGGVSSLMPAFKASRLNIVDALRYR